MVQGPVLIVGCGVFGLSTAVELVRKGKYVCLLDKYEPPSAWSAANDFNKIIRCEYSDPVYARLAVEALKLWRSDSLYANSFKECGRIMTTPMNHKGREQFEMKGIKNIQELGEGSSYQFYTGSKEIESRFLCLKNTNINAKQQVKFNPDGGLGMSSKTLEDVYNFLKMHPRVTFHFGDKGTAIGVKKYKNGEVGIITESGFTHTAPTVIMATGANTGSLLDLENQQSATGLFVTHIQLSDEEYKTYIDLPVIFDAEIGYFFPPDPTTKIMKLCVTGSGIKRTINDPHNNGKQISLPRFHDEYPKDTIPIDLIPNIRELLKKYVPELQNHKLFGSKICWIGDREGSNFLIDKVPKFWNLYVATGDSGHGYKFFPNIGKYIIDMVEGTLAQELQKMWKWESRMDDNIVDPAESAWRTVKKKTRDLSELEFHIETEVSKF